MALRALFGFNPSRLRLGAMLHAWRHRRVVGHLGRLDDRMLADIGVTRNDVWSALAEPFFVDPSEALAERARDTRRGRHAAALEQRGAAGQQGRHAA